MDFDSLQFGANSPSVDEADEVADEVVDAVVVEDPKEKPKPKPAKKPKKAVKKEAEKKPTPEVRSKKKSKPKPATPEQPQAPSKPKKAVEPIEDSKRLQPAVPPAPTVPPVAPVAPMPESSPVLGDVEEELAEVQSESLVDEDEADPIFGLKCKICDTRVHVRQSKIGTNVECPMCFTDIPVVEPAGGLGGLKRKPKPDGKAKPQKQATPTAKTEDDGTFKLADEFERPPVDYSLEEGYGLSPVENDLLAAPIDLPDPELEEEAESTESKNAALGPASKTVRDLSLIHI